MSRLCTTRTPPTPTDNHPGATADHDALERDDSNPREAAIALLIAFLETGDRNMVHMVRDAGARLAFERAMHSERASTAALGVQGMQLLETKLRS